jgi:hypothetical protein
VAKKDWQVGPVLKDKVGSQGTLFRGGTKYSSDRRYPKGYTPERRDEVAEAVVRPSVRNYTNKPQEQFTGTQSGYYKDRMVRTSGDMSAPMVHDSAQATRNLVDTIARSTVPTAHLSGVQFRTNASEYQLGANVAGHHDSQGDALSKGDSVIRLKGGAEATSTTIHEIGHHVSNQQGHAWRANYSFDAPEGGQEEAYADNYADQHYRDRKGRPEPRGIYGGGPYGGRIERSDEFWGGYRANRHYAPDKVIDAENSRYFRHFPEEQQHPDGSVDVPLIHRERDYGRYDPETGRTRSTDSLGDLNDEAIPSHTNFDWGKYRG